MSGRKHISRSRKKVNLLKSRLDFQVPQTKIDPTKSKSVPASMIMEERDINAEEEDGDDVDDDFVYGDWEERVDDDGDNNNNLCNANSGLNKTISKNTGCQRRTRESPTLEGRTYPTDMWFLIGKYLHPETVQTFALICRGSSAVVKTFQFWAALYQRIYDQCKRSKSLGDHEEELKASRVVRPLGVKYHVIRALFKIYSPFQEVLDRQKLNSVDFDVLKGYKCSSFWLANPAKSIFIFNLLLERPQCSVHVDKSSLFHDTTKAVSYNPYQDTCLLQIICDQFVPVISPMGLHIADTKYNTSRDMRNMRLELGLSTTQNLYMSSKKRIEEMRVFDPVCSVRILPWWHPNYPTTIQRKIPESSATDDSWDS